MEILKIDAKVARTIGTSDDGTTTTKQYKMGNYVPSLEARKINTDIAEKLPGLHEQDDDRVLIKITPPTGATNYIISYVITGLIGLIVTLGGVIFIKKKVLKR